MDDFYATEPEQFKQLLKREDEQFKVKDSGRTQQPQDDIKLKERVQEFNIYAT